jgi:integrase
MSEEVLKDKFVEEWLNAYKGNTLAGYKRHLPKFVSWLREEKGLALTPTEIIQSRTQQWVSLDPNKRGYWEKILTEYKEFLESKGYRATSIHDYLIAPSSYFSFYRVPLKFRARERRIISKKAPRKKSPPSNLEIRTILNFADTMEKALITLAYQTGLSQVDLSQLRIEDLGLYLEGKVNREPIYFQKNRSKSGELVQTVISEEALFWLDNYLKLRGYPREGYLFCTEGNRAKSELLRPRRMHEVFKILCEKALTQERAKAIAFKDLRDSFNDAVRRALNVGEASENVVADRLMGHKPKNASANYQVSEQTIKLAYSKVFPLLSVGQGPTPKNEIEEIKTTLQQLRDELEYVRRIAVEMVDKYRVMKEINPKLWAEVETKTAPKKEAP